MPRARPYQLHVQELAVAGGHHLCPHVRQPG
eukprot:SAG11_NODE_23727_length_384_cov_0.543860_1_plen_30_part_10